MKTPRTRAREAAFQILYRFDLEAEAARLPYPQATALDQSVQAHFDHWDIQEESRDFARNLTYGALREIESIDKILGTQSPNWKLNRMASVDRTLLRLGIYEILYCQDIHANITINEYVEMAKLFGTAETAGFVNGLLDAIAKANPKNT